MKVLIACVALTALAPLAAAQQKSAQPDPADPAAAAPPAKYVSPFAAYVPYREQDIGSWRGVNDEAAKAGGHAGIFGGAGHAPAKPATKPSAMNAPGSGAAPAAARGAGRK